MFTVVVTGSAFTLNAAVTVQFAVMGAVTNGLVADAAPQALALNPAKL
jgi:hypothetical protein